MNRRFQYDEYYSAAAEANVFLHFSDNEEEEAFCRVINHERY